MSRVTRFFFIACVLGFTVLSLFVWTWIWLLPMGGFHHMVRWGILGWAIEDGEADVVVIRWSGTILAISLVTWAIGSGAIGWAGRWATQALRRRPPGELGAETVAPTK